MDFNNNERNNQDPNKRKKNKTNLLICLMAALFAIGLIFFLNSEIQRNTEKEITYTKFIEMLKKDQVKKVTFQSNMIVIEPKTKEKVAMLTVTYYTGYVNDEKLVQDLLNKYGVEFTAEIQSSSGIMDFLLSYILPIAGLWILLWFFMRSATKGGGIMGGVGKSNAKMYVEKKTGVTFKDVAGEEEAKESLTELVDFLKNPDKYKKIGARLPKGALLVGPPGTGKTLLAKALAGEAGVPFFSLSGSDFVEMFVGVGASRVRDLFKQATSMAPCIIFIDEIDAIGKSRDSQYGGGNDEREQTLNQLLSEMDGFDSSKGIIILGATNRPEVLDKALLRPGRFDRRIIVEKADLKGRVDVLKVHSHDVIHRNKFADNLIMVLSLLTVSTPSFFLALILMLIFCLNLRWLPSIGMDTWQGAVLPIATLGLQAIGSIARTTRSAMLDVIHQDYIRTSRSRGVPERVITYRHAFKNALIPVLTTIGLRFGGLLAGATLVETVFSIPGIGRFVVDSVSNRDYPAIQGAVLVLAVTFVLVNTLVDLLYAAVDPRVKYD